MKAFAKIVACALLTMSAVNASAFSSGVKVLLNTVAGKNLGNSIARSSNASEAEVLAAINTHKDKVGILAAIDAFNAQAKAVAGDLKAQAAAKSANENLAASMFSVNGQVVATATLASKYAARINTDQNANKGTTVAEEDSAPSCAGAFLNVDGMAKGTRMRPEKVQEIIASGALKRGTCEENPADIPDETIKQVVLDTADLMMQKGTHKLKGAAKRSAGAKALQEAYKMSGVTIEYAEALRRFAAVVAKCGWW